MTEIHTMEDFRNEWNKEKVKRKIGEAWWKTKRFIDDNKEMVMLFGPMVGGGIATLVKGGIKHGNLKKEEKIKNLYCYDRSLGHYWKLRRELTNDEWVRVEKRKRNGEKLADILSEMRVLK